MIVCFVVGRRKRRPPGPPRQHKPHRVVISFAGTPLQRKQHLIKPDEKARYREQLPVEADTTRWWLQEQKRWNGHLSMKIHARDKETDTKKEIFVYPIDTDSDLPLEEQVAWYYLGFNAEIYCLTEKGIKPFTADDDITHGEVKYLIDQLRSIRGE